MNTAAVLKRTALMTVLCVGTVGWLSAQYSSPTLPGQGSRSKTTPQGDRASDLERTRPRSEIQPMGQPAKINRTSELIGTKVKNAQGESLGKVKDVVIDYSSGKVAYVVMATSDKLHAVPLGAFQPSADGQHLTLNADKEKLVRAEGFDKDNWPSLASPTFGAEPFWKDNSDLKEQELERQLQLQRQRQLNPANSSENGPPATSPE